MFNLLFTPTCMNNIKALNKICQMFKTNVAVQCTYYIYHTHTRMHTHTTTHARTHARTHTHTHTHTHGYMMSMLQVCLDLRPTETLPLPGAPSHTSGRVYLPWGASPCRKYGACWKMMGSVPNPPCHWELVMVGVIRTSFQALHATDSNNFLVAVAFW